MQFKKLYDYKGTPNKSEVIVRRMPVPLSVITEANSIFLNDAREYGERATQRDIILQMVMRGFAKFPQKQYAKDFTFKKMNDAECTDRVFWIPHSFRDSLKTLVQEIKDKKFDKESERHIAMKDLWVQALKQ